MSWVAVAIGGSAVIGAGAGVYAANRAAGAQSDAAGQALAYQRETDARNQANAAPYIGLGGAAAVRLGGIYGGNGITAEGWNSFLNSPDYQFRFNQGARALENSAAARGGLLGGNFARGITDYGQGMASSEFGNYYNRIFGQAQLGQNAAAGAANNASAMSGQIGATYGNQGAANASGFVGGANAITGSIGSGVQNYLFSNAMNRSSYAPGGIGSNWTTADTSLNRSLFPGLGTG